MFVQKIGLRRHSWKSYTYSRLFIKQFDRVVCEPPIGMRLGREDFESDSYMRFITYPQDRRMCFHSAWDQLNEEEWKLVASIQNGALIRELPTE
jgi:hypothetical protein